MNHYVEVEFRSGKLGYFTNPNNIEIEPDQLVIVEVERGYDIATVIHSSISSPELDNLYNNNKILKIIKIVQDDESKQLRIVKEKEVSAAEKFNSLLPKYPFEMKLIETIYQFDGNKLTFFFTADSRIDFRDFVRELATVFKTRIELHQSTGRDEAKRISGIGMCGYKYCCASFLKRFNQVTIKMVRDQNLSGNLSKISGPCGRLLCCLHYEEDYYVESAREFPEIGEMVEYNKTRYFVYKNDYYNRTVHLSNDDQLIEIVPLDQYKDIKTGKITGDNRGKPKHSNHNKKRNNHR
jgi:cell fate regulator YaaT (PSP1 superfamily)